MRRRRILGYGAGVVGTTALAACSTQQGGGAVSGDLPRVQWRMATSWPQSLDTIYGGAQTVCDRVSALTDGRFTIDPFAAGEIVPGLQVLDAVQEGTVECGHSAAYYYVGKNEALAFGTTVPFGLNAQQQNAWLYHGGGLDEVNQLYADFNVISFPAGNTGVQMGGWFKNNVQTISDLNGLKMRIPGFGGKVMAELGVNVQVLPGGEIFLALERGAIDAAEFVGPYDDEKLGLNEAATYYYYPGWWEPGATLDVTMNLDAWNSLPAEYQEVFKTATYEANINMLAKYDALNGAALESLVSKGTELTAYSDEILTAASEASTALLEDSASKDSTFKNVYDSWKQFRDSVQGWNKVNELGFAQFVNR
ncbi:TRAP transporter substrate-binding protein [cf. Phormidesmis sp. LEGE 11477]|uniref:TRAP transporter substrate-binding protein n=1 Tax=cf. Phormidesmis sp. LEGE 11477 TaxID=1828680 RepID=UPI0018803672|nr:TRAP transporter substrate-binding protein [cf. Phormidesmis sp. LEGE 11477]MBE9064542.1 TRAP transporter substrate-binding protein [cf. Phormidesmis sp. LEGE 11477]